MTGLIILAAGESKRLGRPKQNLLFRNKTLLQLAIDSALGTDCKPIIVVLGANSENIKPGINNPNILTIHNPDWEEGMASSIRCGIKELNKFPDVDGVLIMLCDQPFVNSLLLNSILTKFRSGLKEIVACVYNSTVGVPVCFSKSYFNDLLNLTGHEGAKKILAINTDNVNIIPFASGSVDIDTASNYQDLLARSGDNHLMND